MTYIHLDQLTSHLAFGLVGCELVLMDIKDRQLVADCATSEGQNGQTDKQFPLIMFPGETIGAAPAAAC